MDLKLGKAYSASIRVLVSEYWYQSAGIRVLVSEC
jgi:hypothetical protein